MPIIKSAIKKLRQDEKRRKENRKKREGLKEILKNARKNPTSQNLSEAFSALDKAAKTNLIHKNKAARLKSALSKLVEEKSVKEKPPVKKSVKSAKATKSPKKA